MAIRDSYVSAHTIHAILTGTGMNLQGGSPDALKMMLVTEAITGQDPTAAETGTGGVYLTAEVGAGGGGYTAGGVALTNVAVALVTGGTVKLDCDSAEWYGVSWADGSAPIGCGIYNSTVGNRIIAGLRFGDDDIPVPTAGTFEVAIPTDGFAYGTF